MKRQPGSTRLAVRVTPRASRTEILGFEGETLRVRLQAPPVDGAANTALREVLAKALGLPRSAVALERGESSRDKILEVTGLSREDLRARLAGEVA